MAPNAWHDWAQELLAKDAAADHCYNYSTDLIQAMSEEQLEAFIAKAKNDQSIQDKLKAAKSTEDVVAIAKDHGHEFTADKLTELSEEELEGVAGGGISCNFLNNCKL